MGEPVTAAVAPLVLVVDDYEDTREILGEILELAGMRVEEAATGHEAVDKATALTPDLILLDLSLPGIDGWEVTERLRRVPSTRAVPIIALTAHALPRDHERAMAVGCNAVVTKPCDPGDIVGTVKRLLADRPAPAPGGHP